MWWKAKARPKEEHPNTYPDGASAQESRPPSGGCSAKSVLTLYGDIFPLGRSGVTPFISNGQGQSNSALIILMKTIEARINKDE